MSLVSFGPAPGTVPRTCLGADVVASSGRLRWSAATLPAMAEGLSLGHGPSGHG